MQSTIHEAPMTRWPWAAVLILATISAQGCRPCYELRFARAEATNSFSITNAAQSGVTPVALYATLDNARDGRSYAVIANDTRSGGESFTVTLDGFETPPADRIGLTLSIPLSAGAGDVFTITRAFTAAEQGQWGFRTPIGAGQVELGFSRSVYNFPGNYSFPYVANTASGQIRVLRRQANLIELNVDALVSNGSGTSYRIVGPVLLTTGTKGEVCPSIT